LVLDDELALALIDHTTQTYFCGIVETRLLTNILSFWTKLFSNRYQQRIGLYEQWRRHSFTCLITSIFKESNYRFSYNSDCFITFFTELSNRIVYRRRRLLILRLYQTNEHNWNTQTTIHSPTV